MANGVIYKRIVDYLKQSIEDGSLKIGDAIYSENLLCEKFKVSRTSVRKAIRQMVDENLLISRQGLGTFVKSTGHGIIYNSICMINHYTRMLRYDISDTYYMDMIYGAEEEVNRRQLNFQMFSSALTGEEDIKTKMSYIKVDGAVVDGIYANRDNPGFFTKLTPHVVILDGTPGETEFPTVAPDVFPAFAALLGAAAERKGTVIFLYEDYNTRSRWRLECFRKAAKNFRQGKIVYVNYSENLTDDNFNNIDHYYLIGRVLEKTLAAAADCRTIIADSDHAAVKAMNFLKHKHYIVPEDIAVSGFCGMNLTTMVEPSLTTIRLDPQEMAMAAVGLLLDHINGTGNEQTRLVPCKVLRRKSF